jgi:rhamnosyltransferase
VLLACCNGERYIQQQLSSILNQRRVEVYIVAGDDASVDRTAEFLQASPALQDGRLKWVPAIEPSGSAGQNFFRLMRANAVDDFDFVAFADQDDVWLENKLERACAALTTSGCSGYSAAVTAEWPDGRRALLQQSSDITRDDFLFEGAGQGSTFVMTAALYTQIRVLLLEHQTLTAGLHYHDWTSYALCRTLAGRWYFDSAPAMFYRQHSDNDTGAKYGSAGARKRLLLIRSGWYGRQIAAVCRLCCAAAPQQATVARWDALLRSPRRWGRNMRIACGCLRGGRRRLMDNFVLTAAALCGYI